MKKLYEKSELTFAIVWIVIYCVLQSIANPINEIIGIEYSASAIFCVLQAVFIFAFVKRSGFMQRYGLCKSAVPARRLLYYVPLIILAAENLSNGIAFNYSPMGTVCRVVNMLCVGFVEEIIFRGFLFKAMEKDGAKSAIIVSSVTFGLGHLLNLVNGSGADLVSNLCQVFGAIAIGFLFVTIFYRSGSLIPCIMTHSAINSINTFANGTGVTTEEQIVHSAVIMAISIAYTLFLIRALPKRRNSCSDCEGK